MARGSRPSKHRRPRQRKPGAMIFGLVLTAVVVAGVVLIALARTGEEGPLTVGPGVGEHYHAAIGFNVCGEWKPNTPQYEAATGIHSHGDGFIHLHPFSNAGTGKKANIGLFLKQGGEQVTRTSLELTDGTWKNGDKCANLGGKKGKIRWSVNGKEQDGDPSKYVPHRCEAADPQAPQCDVIALAFLPAGEEIGVPPVARTGQGPTDVSGSPAGQPPVGQPPAEQPAGTNPTSAPGTTPTSGP